MVNLTSLVTKMRHDPEFATQLGVLHSHFKHYGDFQGHLLKPNKRAICTEIYHHEVIYRDMSKHLNGNINGEPPNIIKEKC